MEKAKGGARTRVKADSEAREKAELSAEAETSAKAEAKVPGAEKHILNFEISPIFLLRITCHICESGLPIAVHRRSEIEIK